MSPADQTPQPDDKVTGRYLGRIVTGTVIGVDGSRVTILTSRGNRLTLHTEYIHKVQKP
jgi:hypothetical protein